jgi:hypothetical protein
MSAVHESQQPDDPRTDSTDFLPVVATAVKDVAPAGERSLRGTFAGPDEAAAQLWAMVRRVTDLVYQLREDNAALVQKLLWYEQQSRAQVRSLEELLREPAESVAAGDVTRFPERPAGDTDGAPARLHAVDGAAWPDAPGASAPSGHTDGDAFAPEAGARGSDAAAPGTYTLLVHPFHHFSAIGQFQAALQKIIGVYETHVRMIAQGALELRVNYDGEAPFIAALRELPVEIAEIREDAPYRLSIRLAR